jgi:hypothetical protein
MEGHKAAMAVADMANAPHAEVIDLGAIGTRPCDLDTRLRPRPSNRQALVFVDDAGPWGSWRSRERTKTGHVCWGVAPSLIPHKAGARVNTHRRAAIQVARLLRAGALTPVAVPQGGDEAIRDLRRARDEARGALQTATPRLHAWRRRHDRRDTGRAPWGPAP